jgi:DNA-binding transcriptional regulator YdaS (Cro superfamily)
MQEAHSQSSRVSATEICRITGAANTTMGNIAVQATSHERSQWIRNVVSAGDGKLAIAAAIKLVSPAWMTPKTKWLYLRGMPKTGNIFEVLFSSVVVDRHACALAAVTKV